MTQLGDENADCQGFPVNDQQQLVGQFKTEATSADGQWVSVRTDS